MRFSARKGNKCAQILTLSLQSIAKHAETRKLHFHKYPWFIQARFVKPNSGFSLSVEKLIAIHTDIIGPMLLQSWYSQKSLLISDSFNPDVNLNIVLVSASVPLTDSLICTFCRFSMSAFWTPVKMRARARRWEQDTSAPACPALQVNSSHELFLVQRVFKCSRVSVRLPDVPLMLFSILRCKVWDWRGWVRLGALPERWPVYWPHGRLSVSV